MPELEEQLPPNLKVSIAYDATRFIQASIDEVVKTLGEAVLIVIVVVFLFLGAFRSVLIPVVTIPLSMIGVLFFMQAMGYSINLLTLLAMVRPSAWWWTTRSWWWKTSTATSRRASRLRGRPGGRAGDRRTGGQHDHHPRRGLRADRLSHRPHRRPVQGIRLHPWPAR